MRIRLAGLLLGLLPLAASAQTMGEQVIELTNIQRWTNGQLAPLKYNSQLDAAATGHSTRMGQNNFFMHCDPDTGKTFDVRIRDAGYAFNSAAENIAVGQSSALQVMTGWMNSAGHRANILGSYQELGTGYYLDAGDSGSKRTSSSGCTVNGSTGAGTHYWTQNFGRRSGAVLLVAAREAYRVSTCAVDLYTHASGQSQMRFSNDGSTWSAWENFAANKIWTLSGATNSTATVSVQVRTAGGSVTTATDTVGLAVGCGGGTAPPVQRVFASSFE